MQNVIKIDSESATLGIDAVLTADEVASELPCSKAHVYNAINGKVTGVSALKVIHMGRRVLVRRSSLEIWKQENERCGKRYPHHIA
jgi:hypothetical protein